MMRKALLAAALLVAVMAAGAGYAAIPDSSTGVISACYPKATTARVVRLIDAEAGETCKPSEKPLHWNQAGPTGPAGPQGPAGPPGPPGAGSGLSGYQFVSALSPMNSDTTKVKRVNCPAGKKVVGGGGTASDPYSSTTPLALATSYPVGPTEKEPNALFGWLVGGRELSPTSNSWHIFAWAICVDAA